MERLYTLPRRLVPLFTVLILFIGTCVGATESTEPELSHVTLTVVDERGEPVAGASVETIGMGSDRSPGSDYGIKAPLEARKTNIQGKTEVPYPRFVQEDLPTTSINVVVDHPNFVRKRERRISTTRPQPIALEPGGKVILKAHRSGSKKPLMPVRANLSGFFGLGTSWKPQDNGISARLSPSALHGIQAVAFDENGAPLFSKPVMVDVRGTPETILDLEVKKGWALKGRLSENVKRPVRNGIVNAIVMTRLPNQEYLEWSVFTSISANGDFVLEDLPEGEVQLVALCDGYVSQNPKRETGNFRRAQVFKPTKETIEVPMEETGDAEIVVLSPEGLPVPEAEVLFWPNQVFDAGSTLLGQSFSHGEYLLNYQLEGSPKKNWEENEAFNASTDATGKALVKGLPVGEQEFMVIAKDYELTAIPQPGAGARRIKSLTIKPGEITKLTVKMARKGNQSLSEVAKEAIEGKKGNK